MTHLDLVDELVHGPGNLGGAPHHLVLELLKEAQKLRAEDRGQERLRVHTGTSRKVERRLFRTCMSVSSVHCPPTFCLKSEDFTVFAAIVVSAGSQALDDSIVVVSTNALDYQWIC